MAVEKNDYWTVVFWYNLIGLLVTFATIPMFWNALHKTKPVHYLYVSLSGLLGGLGGLTAIFATLGNLSISMAILNLPLSMIFAMLLSRLYPHLLETHTKKVYGIRFVAACIMFVGALALSN